VTSPGALFGNLWHRLSPRAGVIIGTPWHGRQAAEFNTLSTLFATSSKAGVPQLALDYLDGKPVPFACTVADVDERAFVVMCALDQACMNIHPAYPTRLSSSGRPLGAMLAGMKADRTRSGCYSDVTGVGIVVPKGHLTKPAFPSDGEEASGSDISHQFTSLTMVPHPRTGRSLRFVTPSPSKFSLTDGDGVDKVGFAPIAEDRDDLVFSTCDRGSSPYLDTRPSSAISSRMAEVVESLLDRGAGTILLPELVADHISLQELRRRLSSRSGGKTALIVCGSGASSIVDPATGRPHNEAVVMTADGRVLGQQRKLHLFRMAASRMKECAIDCEPGHENRGHIEDAAAGQELIVYDLFGLGRVMVLICEDLQQSDPGGDTALASRPDWILTPVLDVPQEVGRWTHQRAYEIGRKTYSRVVVSCSATLGVRQRSAAKLSDCPDIAIGVCMDGFASNKVHLIKSDCVSTPHTVLFDWNGPDWKKTRIEAR
jgi:hypothetical protein